MYLSMGPKTGARTYLLSRTIVEGSGGGAIASAARSKVAARSRKCWRSHSSRNCLALSLSSCARCADAVKGRPPEHDSSLPAVSGQ